MKQQKYKLPPRPYIKFCNVFINLPVFSLIVSLKMLMSCHQNHLKHVKAHLMKGLNNSTCPVQVGVSTR